MNPAAEASETVGWETRIAVLNLMGAAAVDRFYSRAPARRHTPKYLCSTELIVSLTAGGSATTRGRDAPPWPQSRA